MFHPLLPTHTVHQYLTKFPEAPQEHRVTPAPRLPTALADGPGTRKSAQRSMVRFGPRLPQSTGGRQRQAPPRVTPQIWTQIRAEWITHIMGHMGAFRRLRPRFCALRYVDRRRLVAPVRGSISQEPVEQLRAIILRMIA